MNDTQQSGIFLTHEEISEILADLILADDIGDACGAMEPIINKCGLDWANINNCRDLYNVGYLPEYLAVEYKKEKKVKIHKNGSSGPITFDTSFCHNSEVCCSRSRCKRAMSYTMRDILRNSGRCVSWITGCPTISPGDEIICEHYWPKEIDA